MHSISLQMLAVGVIGTAPKEQYLANGHYVLSFAVAVADHYPAQHDWERHKPAATMWLNCEIWDDLARQHGAKLVKGAALQAAGNVVQSQWLDKNTGEQRKMQRLRITALLSNERLAALLAAFAPSSEEAEQAG